MAVDLLGRHYVNRPVLYHTLLVRVKGLLEDLEEIFKHLEHLKKKRSLKVIEKYKKNINLSMRYITQGANLFLEIANDVNTLIYRDEKDVDKEYDRLIKSIDKILEQDRKVRNKKSKQVEKALSKKDRKWLESLKKELEDEKKKYERHAKIKEEVRIDKENLHRKLDLLAHSQYLRFKYHTRDTASTEAFREIDIKRTSRIITLMRRKVIDKDKLSKKILKAENNLLKKLTNNAVLKLDELEERGVQDDEFISHEESILLHRLQKHFANLKTQLDSELHNEPAALKKEWEYSEQAENYLHKVESILFSQSKKILNE